MPILRCLSGAPSAGVTDRRVLGGRSGRGPASDHDGGQRSREIEEPDGEPGDNHEGGEQDSGHDFDGRAWRPPARHTGTKAMSSGMLAASRTEMPSVCRRLR